ncbi:MAG: hypothetical protein U0694_10220 [Anaerolineae bacterium]
MKSKTIPQEIYNKVETELLEGEQLLLVGLPARVPDWRRIVWRRSWVSCWRLCLAFWSRR